MHKVKGAPCSYLKLRLINEFFFSLCGCKKGGFSSVVISAMEISTMTEELLETLGMGFLMIRLSSSLS